MKPSDLGERGRIGPPNPREKRKGCTAEEGLNRRDFEARPRDGHCRMPGDAGGLAN